MRRDRTTAGAASRIVADLPDTSMCGPHRHRHQHQVFGYTDAAHLAVQAYNALRGQDGRLRWQDLDLGDDAHVALRDEALRKGERQQSEIRARRRAKSRRKAEAEAAELKAMREDGKRCGNCHALSDPPSQMSCRSEPGQFTCDLYSDFHGYVLVRPGDLCKRWRPLNGKPALAPQEARRGAA